MGVAVLVVANDFHRALGRQLPAIERDLHTNVATRCSGSSTDTPWSFGACSSLPEDAWPICSAAVAYSSSPALPSSPASPSSEASLRTRGVLPRLPLPHGHRRRDDVARNLGMTYGLLPREKAGLAGGADPGRCGIPEMRLAHYSAACSPTPSDGDGSSSSIFLSPPPRLFSSPWVVVPCDVTDKNHGGIDYSGTAVLSIGLLALLLALDWALDLGWTAPLIVFLFALAAVALVGFLVIERRAGESALVPATVMQNRAFLAAGIATLLASAIFFAALLYLPQFMAKVLGFTAIGSGAGLLPMMGTFMVTSFIAGRLYQLLGPKLIVTLGALLLGAGMILLSRITGTTTYDQLIFGMVVLGIGVGLFYSSITTAAITALDPSQASLAGAIVYMFQIAGGSIGVGFNTAIVVSGSSMPAGIHTAFLVDGLLAIGSAAVAILFVGGALDLERLREVRHHHRAHA